jgi:hypothetical protein
MDKALKSRDETGSFSKPKIRFLDSNFEKWMPVGRTPRGSGDAVGGNRRKRKAAGNAFPAAEGEAKEF